jgi:predicted porin
VKKKKLAVLVAAGTLVAMPLAAQAMDAEFYGEAHLSVDFSDNEAPPTSGNDDSALSVNSNTSKLGFKGSEKLSDTLSVVWQYETEVELDDGTLSAKGRDTYAGLKGSWGLFKAGNLSNAMKKASSKIDIFSNSRADHNAMVGIISDDSKKYDNRQNNTIWYSTPKLGGVTGVVTYSANTDGEGSDELPDKSNTRQESDLSLSIAYDKGPLYLAVATETMHDAKDLTAGIGGYDDVSGTKLVGRWDFGQGTKVGLVYEDLESAETGLASGDSRSAIYLNAAHKVGNTTYKAAYGQADDIDNQQDSGASHYALAAYHSYSKDTQLYTMYTAMDNDSNATYGLKDMKGVQGKTISALSFGLIKRFSSK